MPWQKAIETGLKRAIAANKLSVRLYQENLDGGRFSLGQTAEAMRQFFKAKYAHTHIDMVISEGFPAARMMTLAADLFPRARFLGVQSPQDLPASIPAPAWATFCGRWPRRPQKPRSIIFSGSGAKRAG